MGLINTLHFITTHPLNTGHKIRAVWRFVSWQLKARLVSKPYIHPFTNRSKLVIEKGMTGATGNVYCGLHEFNDMGFLLHFLRPGDLFADIGANIGSYTILASGHIGAHSISVEPLPATFQHLHRNIAVNKITGRVKALNIALGAEEGSLAFTTGLDTMNHVAAATDINTITVAVNTLDNVLAGQVPLLVKIDVEGFETEVLKGGKHTLQNQDLKAIIIELNGSGDKYGYDEEAIHLGLLQFGFKPYIYLPKERQLKAVDGFGSHNTIYLRDVAWVKQRLRTADAFAVLGQSI